MSTVVTRFAPSPTGFLHVGGARTALFNWLLARNLGGKFILRVEDTDRERSTPEAVQAILDGMTWLELAWDELYYQSERASLHVEAVRKMLDEGSAYWCACTPDEVDAMRQKAMAEKRKPKYDGTCRDKGLAGGAGHVVRLKAPLAGETGWTDFVKGQVSYPNQELDDLVLQRSDGSPTYNLAVVADDSGMGVTHVIRGDDHLANTPKQLLIYQALGLTPPSFGHVPMILGPDKKKLSKRHGAESVVQYKDDGFLVEAMANYLLRLGWGHGDKEIFSRQEMTELFTPNNLGSSPAVFDVQKLTALNAHYMKEADPAALAKQLPPFVQELDLAADESRLAALAPLFQPRAQTLRDMAGQMAFALIPDDALAYDDKAVAKFLKPEAASVLALVRDMLEPLQEPVREADVQAGLEKLVESGEISFKKLAQPVRVALTGKTASPGLSETIAALGKPSALARLAKGMELCGAGE